MRAKKIFIWILFAVLFIVWFEGMASFWSEHSYYKDMILNWKNWWLVLSAGVSAIIPLIMLWRQKVDFKGIFLSIGWWLSLFMILHELILGNLVTLFAVVPLIFNTLVLYCLSILFIISVFSLWNRISRKLNLFKTIRWQETFLTFGIGLITFLLVIQILAGAQIFYSAISRIFFIALLCLAWFERKHFAPHKEALLWILENLNSLKTSTKLWWIFSLLIIFSFWYYFFNFSHSYIPYSTAWDANHEYMYIPKVVSEHHWILWWNRGPASGMMGLRHAYIAFFFSVWSPISSVLNIAKDTIAVNLNALSWAFVLLFGLWALKESLPLFRKKEDDEENAHGAFLVWWSLILMWLTSWMGAFLVFVDNKTDMWVLALSLLAILSWFIFLNYSNKRWAHIENKQSLKYLLVSAVLFSFAVIAKVTAFIDVLVFALIMVWFCLNTTTLIWLWIMFLWVMGFVQPLFTFAFINKDFGILIFVVWFIIALIWLVRWLIWKTDAFTKRLKQMVIWWCAIVLTVLVFKGPWTAIAQISSEWFDVKSFFRTTLLAKNIDKSAEQKIFLAQVNDEVDLDKQAEIDTKVLVDETKDITYNQCIKQSFDEEELNSTKETAPWNSLKEDVWRYVWFWRREFKKTGFGGALLKLFFWKNNACFWWDSDWRKLCKNANLIEKQDISKLKELDENELSKNGEAHELIQNLIEAKTSWDDLRDYFTAIETYYQEHSIKTTDEGVYIPYRYIVPLNVVFNRSLQNHSSYYTDIGLIWLCVFVIMLGWLVYAICTYDKKRKNLLIIGFSTIIWWIIRRAIAWWIVWYGLWLIIWSIFVVSSFIQEWTSEGDETYKMWVYLLIWLLSLYIIVQAVFNVSRIATQGSSWPFWWYKSNVWERQTVSDKLEFNTEKVYTFNAQDIFALQFGQYQPFIDAVKDRKDEDWVMIAGTYIQYFLDNQKNIVSDGMLNWLWEETSDVNSCRSYQRLKNENIKYLIIDPNIGTVGRAGDWNESLFYRFFARLSTDEKSIQTHWAITMLIKMAQEWYLDLIYTNNIGAKYAFQLSDSDLIAKYGMMGKEDLILLRAKMAVAKFFYTEQDLLDKMFVIFQERILNGKGIWDVASILWKQVDEKKLLPIVQDVLNWDGSSLKNLSQDEKYVVAQFAWVYRLLTNPGQANQASEVLTQLFQNSLFGSSQVIGLELR